MNPKNLILTGPPRSGTTLTCTLLNLCPQVVALHEPMNLQMFPDRTAGLDAIRNFFPAMRQSLLETGTALSKVADGGIPDNPFTQEKTGLRKSIVQKDRVAFNKPLDSDFTLVIKQNAHFTFLLDDLLEEYPCAAVIRNPVSVIASWQTIDAPVSRGNLTVLRGLDPRLSEQLDRIPDLLDRQVRLLHELFLRYVGRQRLHIVRYEDIVRTGGQALSSIVPAAADLDSPLRSRNRNNLYDPESLERIRIALLAFDGAYLDFYPASHLHDI